MHPNFEIDFLSNRESLLRIIDNISELIEDFKTESLKTNKFTVALNYPQSDFGSEKSFKILEIKSANLLKKSEIKLDENIDFAFTNTYEYLKKLKSRLQDNLSKVLITGDLNSGKSTLINAILRQNILPTDQQPCTQSFCEIIPCQEGCINMTGKIKAFTSVGFGTKTFGEELSHFQMQKELQDEDSKYKWFKIITPVTSDYVYDLNNIFVSFIDSPGLNTDLFKTNSLFSQQQDIDVVVFVVNASFHLTLSGKEFLEQAAKEKEKIFIIVNKVDEIENFKKCKKIIMKQIREILPQTFEDARDLIHFISAKEFLKITAENGAIPSTSINVNVNSEETDSKTNSSYFFENFNMMKKSLLNFIYLKRSVSKLSPAKTYSTRLLQEIKEISSFNLSQMTSEMQLIESKIEISIPIVENQSKDAPLLKSELNSVVSKASETCFANVFNISSKFSDEIPKIMNITSLFGIWNIRKIINENYRQISNRYTKTILEIEKVTSELKHKGIEDLVSVTKFYKLDVQNNDFQVHEFKLYSSMPLHRPSLLDMIDPRELFKSIGTLNITSVIGVIVGYQPCLNVVWKFADRLRINPLFISAIIFGGIGLITLYKASSSIERVIMLKLENYFLSRFNKEIWARDIAERCSQSVTTLLSSRSSHIYITYQRMLESNRINLAEIYAESERLHHGLSFLNNMNKRIENLLINCSEIKL